MSKSPAAKTERLLNLVICLLYTRQPLSKQRIRDAVEPYRAAESVEAFERMFERDKDELRALGIPLRAEQVDAWFDDEIGYRIDRREYALPDISFEADEITVLGLAARTWQQASLAGSASAALRKLQATDVAPDEDSLVGIEPRLRTQEAAFPAMLDAVLTRTPVRFAYRKPSGESAPRRLQPWAVANWHGRWYVTGHDLDRDAPRVFRLGRVTDDVTACGAAGSYEIPDEHDPLPMIDRTQAEGPPHEAAVLVRPGSCHALRRRATSCTPATDEQWDELTLAVGDLDQVADEIAALGAAAVVTTPPDLRDAVVRHHRATLRRHTPHQEDARAR